LNYQVCSANRLELIIQDTVSFHSRILTPRSCGLPFNNACKRLRLTLRAL